MPSATWPRLRVTEQRRLDGGSNLAARLATERTVALGTQREDVASHRRGVRLGDFRMRRHVPWATAVGTRPDLAGDDLDGPRSRTIMFCDIGPCGPGQRVAFAMANGAAIYFQQRLG